MIEYDRAVAGRQVTVAFDGVIWDVLFFLGLINLLELKPGDMVDLYGEDTAWIVF